MTHVSTCSALLAHSLSTKNHSMRCFSLNDSIHNREKTHEAPRGVATSMTLRGTLQTATRWCIREVELNRYDHRFPKGLLTFPHPVVHLHTGASCFGTHASCPDPHDVALVDCPKRVSFVRGNRITTQFCDTRQQVCCSKCCPSVSEFEGSQRPQGFPQPVPFSLQFSGVAGSDATVATCDCISPTGPFSFQGSSVTGS